MKTDTLSRLVMLSRTVTPSVKVQHAIDDIVALFRLGYIMMLELSWLGPRM